MDKLLLYFEHTAPAKVPNKRFGLMLSGALAPDVLILGSSKPARDILAGQLSRRIGRNCYNLGYLGAQMPFTSYLADNYFRYGNRTPRYCIISLDDNYCFGEGTPVRFEREDVLLPYVGVPEVREQLTDLGVLKKIPAALMVSCRLEYKFIRFGNLPVLNNERVDAYGSTPVEGHKAGISLEAERQKYAAHFHPYDSRHDDPQVLADIQHIKQLFKEKHTQLIFVFCPNYRRIDTLWEHRVKELFADDAVFYHYQPAHFDTSCFYDNGHLNMKGARIFTDDIACFFNETVRKQ